MWWRLILEEYSNSPELIYIQGSKNITADAVSRLDIVNTPNTVENNIKSVNEHYGLEDEDISHPTNHKTIMRNQQKDKDLTKITQNNKDYFLQNFHWSDKNVLLSMKIAK